jgi:hypothetical protein
MVFRIYSLFGAVRVERWSGLSTRCFHVVPLVAGLLAFAPSVAAECFPSIPSGYHVPFKMSTHGKNHVVSYAEGNFYPQSGYLIASPYHPKQFFNDRAWAPGDPLYEQPFAHDYADYLGVKIEKKLGFYSLNGVPQARYVPYVTLRLWSWGGGELTFPVDCTLSSNLLQGSINNDTLVFISLGSPVPN